MEAIKGMPVSDGVPFLLYAFEQEEEDKLFQRWVAGPQLQYGYDEFKNLLKPVEINEKATFEKLDAIMDGTRWSKVEIGH